MTHKESTNSNINVLGFDYYFFYKDDNFLANALHRKKATENIFRKVKLMSYLGQRCKPCLHYSSKRNK